MSGEWIAIVNFDQGRGPRPVVIQDDDDSPVLFDNPGLIRELSVSHALRDFDWYAFRVTTGQVEDV